MNNITIVCPFYNEETIIEKFVEKLVSVIHKEHTFSFSILMVDDGSIDSGAQILEKYPLQYENVKLEVLRLKSNQGHQLAIYNGLRHVEQKMNADRIIVMDSDGEDDPRAILEMLKLQDADIVHVTRGKRSEGTLFKVGYFIYKKITSIIIGVKIDFGNFSMINNKILTRIVGDGFIHYAAHLSKYQGNIVRIKSDRLKRLGGTPKMNFDKLILHGLNSLAEYSEQLILFLVKLIFGVATIIGIVLLTTLYLKLSGQASPGWASNLMASLFNSLLICFGFLLMSLILIKDKSQKTNRY